MKVLIYGGKWKSVSEKLVEIKIEISQMENNLNICGFLLHKIGRAHIEGSKSNFVTKTLLPYKAVMSVGLVGYPGSEGWVLDVALNPGYRVNNNNNNNNNDFLVFVVNVGSIFHFPNISYFIIFVTNFITT